MHTNFTMAGILSISLLLTACAAHGPACVETASSTIPTGFIDMTTTAGGQDQPCVLYVPRDYDPARSWPLIVFLHGAGERGSDGLRQTSVGIGPAIRQFPNRFPCLVLMPQCPRGHFWSPSFKMRDQEMKNALPFVDDAMAQVLTRYNIDHDRVSLTGLSMGGYGTFIYGAQHIDKFSALMPICGGGRVEDAAILAKVPVRVFHGADDQVVPPEKSKEMVEAIKAAGGDVEYTEFPDTGHDSWDKVYRNSSSIKWLLEQKRP